MIQLPKINVKKEKEKIISFLKKTLSKQSKKNIVLGMSGGIDSTVSFYLLKEAVESNNIFIAHLYYFKSELQKFKNSLEKAGIPDKNILDLSIRNPVDGIKKILNIPDKDKLRIGNIIARVRMTILYDLAKKHNALVLGTEDKSEFYLGYFTRFGDEASDIEPIRHLYKTQVYQLAKYLGVQKEIINQESSPGLWLGQTAEKELGFSYQEADVVLYLYKDGKMPIAEISKTDFPNAQKIIDHVNKNSFKHKTPHLISLDPV